MFEFARDERLIADNPAKKLESRRACSKNLASVTTHSRRFVGCWSQAHGREHLVLRIFINCGLRPGELFALREDDIETGHLRIDEAIKIPSVAPSGLATRRRQAAART